MAEQEFSWSELNERKKVALRNSYNVQTLSRVQTVLRAVKQTEALGRKLQREIETTLLHSKKKHSKHSELEKLILQKRKIQDECDWRRRKLQTEKDLFDATQTGNLQKERTLKQKYEALKKDRSRLHEKKKLYFSVREDLIKSGAQLVMRRKQLISELAFIYPIREVSSNTYTIAGIELPNAEQFQGWSDVLIEVAMGYTCHLVIMISHFLDVPVRYAMKHCGSKSLVYDYILDKLSDKEREFVLSSRGHEKFQFDYGVYLLNKNIAQLRYYCGLGTTDLRLTLPNLKTLLQLRLGVNFDHLESSQTELLGASLAGASAREKAKHTSESVSSGVSSGKTDGQPTDPSLEESSSQTQDVFAAKPDSFFEVTGAMNHKAGEASQESNSVSGSATNPPSKLPSQPRSLLDQLTKEKLLGPIANEEEIDVSSSEDSASAVYRSKLCPRLENLHVSAVPETRPTRAHSQSPRATRADSQSSRGTGTQEGESENDTECSDVEGVATFSHRDTNTQCKEATFSHRDTKMQCEEGEETFSHRDTNTLCEEATFSHRDTKMQCEEATFSKRTDRLTTEQTDEVDTQTANTANSHLPDSHTSLDLNDLPTFSIN